jgi:hypothetical protein
MARVADMRTGYDGGLTAAAAHPQVLALSTDWRGLCFGTLSGSWIGIASSTLIKEFSRMTRPDFSATRRLGIRWRLALVGVLLGILTVVAVVWQPRPAAASVPVDRRSIGPNHASEMAGAGFLLTDPLQGSPRAYWAGAYRTIPGMKSYCVDDFYDYPSPSYSYRTVEASSWAARRGSNGGARGHQAQRIVWIINSYGQSASAITNAAVSMAVNLLTESAPFKRSYEAYFKRQLNAISPAIAVQVNQLLADSDRFAGPYTTRITFGPAPAVGGIGQFAVSIRSARGVSLRNASFRVISVRGGVLRSRATGSIGPSGVARVPYTALAAGEVSATAYGMAPNVTMRLGYSPSHNTSSFSTGSQRVALASSTRLKAVRPGRGSVTVLPPRVSTAVVAGNEARTVGTLVTDRVVASGLVPRVGYSIVASLVDSVGSTCGTVTAEAIATNLGTLSMATAAIAVCGGGTNTFVEQLRDRAGHVVAQTPPGQPPETFPVTPRVTTAVVGGVGPRKVGVAVRDQVVADGLLPNTPYRLEVTLQDSAGRRCGVVTSSAVTDSRGVIRVETAPIVTCGTGSDTFSERILDQAGTPVASAPPGQTSETFRVISTAVIQPAPPRARPHVAVKPAVHPVTVPRPVPTLAATGGAPSGALILGIALLTVGIAALAWCRRQAS